MKYLLFKALDCSYSLYLDVDDAVVFA